MQNFTMRTNSHQTCINFYEILDIFVHINIITRSDTTHQKNYLLKITYKNVLITDELANYLTRLIN
jgi:hypothetical protein